MVSILIATPHAAFGELLRISLEESGHYQIRLVGSAKEARASAARVVYQLAILDSELEDEPFVPLCYDLISQPMQVMVVPPDNNPNHPSLGGLIPHGYLNRPFYLPDLLETVQNLTQSSLQPALAPPSAPPAWASDTLNLQQLLDQELSNCDAVSILIGVQGSLMGNSGSLNETSAREMAGVVLRYWDPKEKTDLMRYVRLSNTKGDYLAYATALVNDLVLMMIFSPGAQLSQVRPQTKQIASNLIASVAERQASSGGPAGVAMVRSNNGNTDRAKTNESGSIFHQTASAIDTQTEQREDEGLFSLDGKSFTNGSSVSDWPSDPAGQQVDLSDPLDAGDEDFEARKVDLSLLLGSIPSPDPLSVPEKSSSGDRGLLAGWFPEPDEWQAAGVADEVAPTSQPAPDSFLKIEQQTASSQNHDKTVPATPLAGDDLAAAGETDQPKGEFPVLQSVQKPAETGLPDLPSTQFFLEPEPEIDPLSDTRPRVVSTIASINQLEPVSSALSLLNYTCVLLPRLPQHYLTGELADRLAQWVQHLCLAFGWRLEGISLRPEYLQWTVQVAPSVSPGNLVRIIRQRTSLHIFNTYEYIKQQNPSGDFWATGYLIVSGPQPPSAQLLREYIAQTRKRQGITKI